ncbi:MAG TPA: hypothetical protein PLD80_09430 [Rugosibacter sp.]|nr:hypothetical protein [Rugosibacter sp.]HQN45702.1 hypothetical protein [Rugosibacter sp.]
MDSTLTFQVLLSAFLALSAALLVRLSLRAKASPLLRVAHK